MNKRTRNIISAAALVILLQSANAAETNFILSDSTGIKFNSGKFSEPVLKQKESLSPSIKIPFTQDGTVYFVTEAQVEHTFDATFKSSNNTLDNSITLDLPLFKAAAAFDVQNGASVLAAAGRFSVSDLTAVILSQSADGIFASFDSPRFTASAYAGFTGLLNARTVSFTDSAGTDLSDNTSSSPYTLADPYTLIMLSCGMPYLVFNQSLSLETLAVFGPNDGKSRMYATVGLNGPLAQSVFYSASTTLGAKNFEEFSNLSMLSVEFYPDFLDSRAVFSAEYASGNNGGLSAFTAFTKSTATLAADEPAHSAILKCGASYSLCPQDKVFCQIGSGVIFKVPGNSAEYSGIQIQGLVKYQPFTDLSISFSIESYLADKKEEDRTSATFFASLAF